jgi:hypothetical protein
MMMKILGCNGAGLRSFISLFIFYFILFFVFFYFYSHESPCTINHMKHMQHLSANVAYHSLDDDMYNVLHNRTSNQRGNDLPCVPELLDHRKPTTLAYASMPVFGDGLRHGVRGGAKRLAGGRKK